MRPEEIIETALVRAYKKVKGAAYKFTSPGRRGVPDRLCLGTVPIEHQAIVAKYVKFVECKAPGKKPGGLQLSEHKKLRDRGFCVLVLDHKITAADELIAQRGLKQLI